MLPPKRKATLNHDPNARTAKDDGTAKGMGIFEEIGSELGKDAKVWKTYVDETDRLDKELVEGWNGSMDVLLIFAALFSALTTAMLVESSKQLQPDPAIITAKTLILITQALIAFSSNGTLPTPDLRSLESSFIITNSSEWVNMLWFTSLSLSVAVSLIAMLLKSWCYSFISGRSGSKYQQAHRRQQRWDALKTWRMQEFLIYLPVLMHAALLFFSIGLCIHLSNLNASAAFPVFCITFISLGFYFGMTVLPLVYPLCPYSTPLSSFCPKMKSLVEPLWKFPAFALYFILIAFLSVILGVVFGVGWLLYQLAYQLVRLYVPSVSGHVNSAFNAPMMNLAGRWGGDTNGHPKGIHPHWDQNKFSLQETPVDETTWRMLGWLISHSEDSSCADVALQSIAGARTQFSFGHALPYLIPHLILERIGHCFWMDSRTGLLRLRKTASIDSVLQYCRTLSYMVTNSPLGLDHSMFHFRPIIGELGAILQYCDRFFDPKSLAHGTSTSHNLAAIATSAFVPLAHWKNSFCKNGQTHLVKAQHQLAHLAQLHLDGEAVLHPGALLALVEASPHWAIDYIPKLPSKYKSRSLTVLVCLLDSPDCAMSQSQHSIGLALTLASLGMNSYSGWERPPGRHSNRQRAFEAYFHHATQGYEITTNLIAFGLLGILNKSNGCVFTISTIETILQAFAQINNFKPSFQQIYSLPSHFTVDQYIVDIILQYMKLVEEDEYDAHNEAAAALCLKYLPSCLGGQIDNSQLYKLAVSVFSSAQSDDLRTGCSALLSHLKIPTPIVLARTFINSDLFYKLFKISLSHSTPFSPIAMRHLWSISSGIFEVGRSDAFSIFSEMLKDSEFVSRLASAPGEPAFPQNFDAVGLADIWYPLFQEMKSDTAVRRTVVVSGVIPTMIEFYSTCTGIHAGDLQKRAVTLDRLRRLYELYDPTNN